MVNVNIIEGNDDNLYQKFVELYNNIGFRVSDIVKTLGITMKRYYDLREKAIRNGDVISRKSPSKNYSFNNGRWTVRKFIDGKQRIFGTYGSEEDAARMVEALKEVDWDKSQYWRIRYELGI